MKIRFLSGPKTGEVSHAPWSQQTQLMIDAGLIEVIPMPPRGSAGWLAARNEEAAVAAAATAPQPDPKVEWTINEGTLTHRIFISACCARGCGTLRYENDPVAEARRRDPRVDADEAWRTFAANLKFHHSCAAYMPEPVPASVVAAYRAKKTGEVVVITSDEAAFFKDRHSNATPVEGSVEQL